jgi:hypothetical protein
VLALSPKPVRSLASPSPGHSLGLRRPFWCRTVPSGRGASSTSIARRTRRLGGPPEAFRLRLSRARSRCSAPIPRHPPKRNATRFRRGSRDRAQDTPREPRAWAGHRSRAAPETGPGCWPVDEPPGVRNFSWSADCHGHTPTKPSPPAESCRRFFERSGVVCQSRVKESGRSTQSNRGDHGERIRQ